MRILVLLSVLSGCSLSVDYTGTFFQCGEGDLCPEGFVCKSDVCVPTEPTPQACSTALAAGDSHTCMIREGDGSVWCWGRNNQGQLGNSSIVDSKVPVQVTGITGATALAAGSEFTCAIVGGGVQCWGANAGGQLGDNSTQPANDPVSVGGLTDVTAIATGSQHTCVVAAGRAQCWGDNGSGQLGDTTTAAHRTPAPVSLTGNVTAIAAAGSTSCAAVDGSLACWGSNANGQFMTGNSDPNPQATPLISANISGVTQVVAGAGGHVCALAGNVVRCAGQNNAGQLGDGTATPSAMPVEAFIPATITTLTAGGDNTCAVDNADRIWCWGSTNEGKLFFGDGVSVSTTSPILTAFPPGLAIALGGAHSCVRTVNGAVSCAGANGQGQLGNGIRTTEPSPIEVEGLTGIVSLVSGDRFTCAADGAGVTKCWGLGSSGQLGDGGFQTRAKPVIALIGQVDKLYAGGSYMCAEKTDGSIACWGSGSSGQLGAGLATRGTPVTIDIANVDQLALGEDHTCEITGTVMRCWGNNNTNKLGDAGSSGPDPITLNNGITSPAGVAVSSQHTCVIDSAGTVQCWGGNNSGVLGRGDGTFASDPLPAPVKLRTDTAADLTDVDEIASRGATVYARQNGLVFGWGTSCPNILGSSNVLQCSNDAASQLDNITNAKKLAIGFSISCVLKEDNTIACWGQNDRGQIGDGTYNFAFATTVPGLSDIVEVAPGSDHVCALRGDGTVACWGNAANGQLANGVLDDRGPAFARLTCGE